MKSIYFILAFIVFLLGCAEEKKVIAKFDFQENRTFTEFLEKDNADRSNYIVTILGMPECDLCDYVKTKIVSYSDLPRNVLFRSVDLTKNENKWLEQLLREFSYPLILITNPQNELVGFVKGARLNVLKEAFQNTFNKRIFFDDGKGLFLNQYDIKEVSSAVNVDFLNTQIQSYLNYEKKESLDPDELDRLRKSVNVYPYFFNTYLLYQFTKEKELLGRLFRTYNANVDQFLYTGLKKNLISTEELPFIDSLGAKLELDRYALQFGEGQPSDKKTVAVKVKNTGVKDLLLTEVVPSCNCVSANWDKKTIPPGGNKVVEVIYELRGLGNYKQQVAFFSNAVEEPAVFTIEGVVKNK